MAYAYGMRFDDDSNAITVIDEDNQTAVTTGYIDGEYVEFGGGNPNRVQTVTATAANPFGDIHVQELMTAIQNNEATAIITLDLNGVVIKTNLESDNGGRPIICRGLIYNTGNIEAEEAYWSLNGNADSFKVASGSGNAYQIQDYTAMASSIATTLTVIWHPLPE